MKMDVMNRRIEELVKSEDQLTDQLDALEKEGRECIDVSYSKQQFCGSVFSNIKFGWDRHGYHSSHS